MSRSDTWSFHLAGYEAAVNRRLETWAAERFIERLWAHDHTLWSPEPLPELTDRLGWLDLPGNMSGAADDLKTFAREVRGDGIETVVLLGMGGSSLAPETFQLVFGHREGYPRLLVLDSTHPGVVQAVHAAITPGRTLFLVSSKSGTTLETLSFFRYFWQVMTGAGVDPGAHFVAITDPGSSLEALASDRGFRRTFPTPPEVGGRYSAMTFFGLVPAALIGLDPAALIAHAARAADRTRAAGAGTEDPALKLGAVMGELARAGRDKITLLTPASLQAYPAWLEQLIAESLGKDGRGIVPVADEPPAPVSSYGEDRLFVAIRLAAGTDRDLARLLRELITAGHPVVTVELAEREALAGNMYAWEVAVAAAGAALGINPFNQPDVQLAKDLARRAMAGDLDTSFPVEEHDLNDSDGLSRALTAWLGSSGDGDYIAVQAYLAPGPESTGRLQTIRGRLNGITGAATTLGFGPRFLHSTGQLHKGGPGGGVFLQLVDKPGDALPIPETEYDFRALIRAQALGDYQALRQRGRRVLRLNLGADPEAGLDTLARVLEELQ